MKVKKCSHHHRHFAVPVVIILILLVVGTCAYGFMPYTEQVTITGFSWKRVVYIEAPTDTDSWSVVNRLYSYGENRNPHWSRDYVLVNGQRDTTRSEEYIVKYSDGTQQAMPYDEWIALDVTTSIPIERRRFNLIGLLQETLL